MSVPTGEFGLWCPVEVRFSDVDVGGHVHHSLALVYFEEARGAYWREVVGRRGVERIDFILAEATIRFHARIFYPQRIEVGVRVPRLGKKHFVMEYLARGEDGRPLLSGSTVQVTYDYGAGRPMAVPSDVREAIEAHDGPFGRGGRSLRYGPGEGG